VDQTFNQELNPLSGKAKGKARTKLYILDVNFQTETAIGCRHLPRFSGELLKRGF